MIHGIMFWIFIAICVVGILGGLYGITEDASIIGKYNKELASCEFVIKSSRGYFTQKEIDHCNEFIKIHVRKGLRINE